jgi:hypothetical protein
MPAVIAACKIKGKLPLIGFVFRGRNSVLISLEKDLCTWEDIDALFNAPDKIRYAKGYINHI